MPLMTLNELKKYRKTRILDEASIADTFKDAEEAVANSPSFEDIHPGENKTVQEIKIQLGKSFIRFKEIAGDFKHAINLPPNQAYPVRNFAAEELANAVANFKIFELTISTSYEKDKISNDVLAAIYPEWKRAKEGLANLYQNIQNIGISKKYIDTQSDKVVEEYFSNEEKAHPSKTQDNDPNTQNMMMNIVNNSLTNSLQAHERLANEISTITRTIMRLNSPEMYSEYFSGIRRIATDLEAVYKNLTSIITKNIHYIIKYISDQNNLNNLLLIFQQIEEKQKLIKDAVMVYEQSNGENKDWVINSILAPLKKLNKFIDEQKDVYLLSNLQDDILNSKNISKNDYSDYINKLKNAKFFDTIAQNAIVAKHRRIEQMKNQIVHEALKKIGRAKPDAKREKNYDELMQLWEMKILGI